jgi:hypothetical protein
MSWCGAIIPKPTDAFLLVSNSHVRGRRNSVGLSASDSSASYARTVTLQLSFGKTRVKLE